MRPVNLTPSGVAAVQHVSGGGLGKQTLLGVVGVVMVCGVSAYFAFAQVSSIKDESTMLTKQQTELQQQQSEVQAQLAELGRKTTTEAVSFSTVADTYEKEVVAKVTSRSDYTKLLRDLTNATFAVRGSWITNVSTGSAGSDTAAASTGESSGSESVKISGYAPSVPAVLALSNNLNATPSISDARPTSFDTTKAKIGGRSITYVSFEMELTFSSTIGSAGASGGLVSSGSQELSLDPQPRVTSAKSRRTQPKVTLTGVAGLAAATSNKRGGA